MLNKLEFNFLTFKPRIPLKFPEFPGKNEYKNVKIREKSFSFEINNWWPILQRSLIFDMYLDGREGILKTKQYFP